jgi:hypothetical protein
VFHNSTDKASCYDIIRHDIEVSRRSAEGIEGRDVGRYDDDANSARNELTLVDGMIVTATTTPSLVSSLNHSKWRYVKTLYSPQRNAADESSIGMITKEIIEAMASVSSFIRRATLDQSAQKTT